MTLHEASRTLLKSPPELWAECSDAASLNRHLDSFGEIRITRLEPETAVAWEGDTASGTVRLEPSGWGTRVILTARGTVADCEEAEPEPEEGVREEPEAGPVEPEPAAVVVRTEPEPLAAEPVLEAEPEPLAPEPVLDAGPDPVAPEPVLDAGPDPAAPDPVQPVSRGGFLTRIKAWMRGPEPQPAASAPVGETEAAPMAQDVPEVNPAVSAPDPDPVSEPGLVSEPDPELVSAPEPEPPVVAEHDTEPVTADASDDQAQVDALTQALDSLGMAHHRPFSRS
jgi:hypothetical protein